MAHRIENETSPWLAFLAGAVIVLAAMLVYMFYVDASLDRMHKDDVRLIPSAPIVNPNAPTLPAPDIVPAPNG